MASARDVRVLGAKARALNRARRNPALPPLLFLTDPQRTPEPWAAVARLPPGSGVIYRHFGAPDRLATARRLAQLCRRRRLTLLVAADPVLAAQVGADGVHLPERLARAAAAIRRARPYWLITVAAHGPIAFGPANAALLSPILPSASPSAARILGARQAAALAARSPLPTYALGGVNARTCGPLRNFVGLAAIEGLAAD